MKGQKMTNTYEKVDKTWSELKTILQFPVQAYLKENGFLGIVSYNPKTDDLFIASKSTNQGDYAGYFKELLLKELGDNVDKFKTFLKKMDSSAIFEVIDIVNDPHIIKYSESGVFLLDVVKNDFSNTFMEYDALELFAKEFNFETKVLFKTCENFESLKELIDYYDDSMYGVPIEGFVVKDSKGFMFKYKTPYYKFWKEVRKYKDRVIKGKEITNVSDKMKDVIEFMKTFDVEVLQKMSVIDVREEYYKMKN
jgi:tRNA splicing ligase